MDFVLVFSTLLGWQLFLRELGSGMLIVFTLPKCNFSQPLKLKFVWFTWTFWLVWLRLFCNKCACTGKLLDGMIANGGGLMYSTPFDWNRLGCNSLPGGTASVRSIAGDLDDDDLTRDKILLQYSSTDLFCFRPLGKANWFWFATDIFLFDDNVFNLFIARKNLFIEKCNH